MPDLLYEYWENEDGGEFGPVQENSDRLRSTLTPGARFVFSLRAASWFQAMQLYHDRMGYGEWRKPDCPDTFATDEVVAVQDAYLARRQL